ncbi:glycine betaine ABC transporter substrate-binding protein [Nocardioides sp. AE5]|uniref:glycine betaine ABC transporter substrate-binding protein n=1 Tax=Nocardioides sp. AE5 TaxID=2962573 RepID=UPI00288250B6|nr:glycine betaine ABC transporter substrate-binding protein [Nocardioides sp. AE5]MDT0202339.1 glycine betaine ABC transporter substrate-binding protein [Nocardioides sp. AE5]
MTLGVGLTLASCGSDDDNSAADCGSSQAVAQALTDNEADTIATNTSQAVARVAPASTTQARTRTAPAPGDTITLGIIPSWSDGLSMAYLWQNLLEQDGYKVEIKEIADAAPLYTGVAQGDVDIYPSAWPEVTHASYMEQYGDQLEDLGAYYDAAKLTIAVPEYVDIDSIEDLVGCADRFDGQIIGIEPGAGLTEVTEQSVIPEYGLEDYDLKTSSTNGMLTELQTAIDNKEDIVVTLWRPFWANSKFPVKDLEDPKGALGEPEGLHFIATKGFSDEYPDIAQKMGNAKLDDEQYGSLEDLVVNEYGEGKEAEAVAAWLEANPDWVDTLG